MGKDNHPREGELNLSPLGTRQAPPSSDAPSCLRSYYSTAFCVCQVVFEKSLGFFEKFFGADRRAVKYLMVDRYPRKIYYIEELMI